ncbi:MAG: flagellar export protein FliJ [Spirochaetia bacterium]|nr:flagellar export protein FliJ [Spirochaetia bacterium]
MKKFKFELAQVLEFRNFEKQQAEGELAKAIAVETQIKDQLQIIAAQYNDLKNIMKGSLNFDDVLAQNNYTKLLDYQKEELLKQLAEAKLVTEEKRKVLQECMKKTTALEKMKEIQFEEYKTALSMEEKQQLENLASIKTFADYTLK